MSGDKYHMNGGDGPHSYAQNSEYQKQVVDSSKTMINELISKHLDIQHPCDDPCYIFKVADFGCSVGPNTFFAVQSIIEAVGRKLTLDQENPRFPQFLAFFNDHSENDFNALFKNLPLKRQYFAAGVPGSFHGRLFPDDFLHVVHCSSSLHWLSKIPAEVVDRNSPAWNRGRIHYGGAPKEVKEAYSAQFKHDVEMFLGSRAQELVGGGLMILAIIGFPDGISPSESSIGMMFNVLNSSLQDMVKLGKLTEERVDLFNLPLYYSTSRELQTLIASNGCFDIIKVEKLSTPMKVHEPDIKQLIQVSVSHLRAVIGPLMEEHFGIEILDELFQIHLEKLVNDPTLYEEQHRKEENYFLFLKRAEQEKKPLAVGEDLPNLH